MSGKNYRVQPYPAACLNCKHVFVRTEHDDPPSYYCTFGASPRPHCLSVSMDEFPKGSWSADESTPYMKAYRAWEEWQKGREVRAMGICDEYKSRPEG